jgi:hypothetical protein
MAKKLCTMAIALSALVKVEPWVHVVICEVKGDACWQNMVTL